LLNEEGRTNFMKNTEKRSMSQPEFIRLVSDIAGFTQGDVKEIYDAIVKVFEDSARFDIELKLRGLGKLKFVELDEREVSGYITQDGEVVEPTTYPPTEKIIFSLAKNIRQAKRRDSN
jgi:nucleoid DNA-binding protein